MTKPFTTPSTFVRGRGAAAAVLGISTRLLFDLERAGKIPVLRHNKRLLFYRRADLDQFIVGQAEAYERQCVAKEAGL